MKNLDNKINNILGGLDFLAPWLIRLGLGIAFIIHGYNKFPLPPQGLINYFGFSPALATFVALSEVFAGIIIIVGGLLNNSLGNLITRLGGLMVVVVMIFAFSIAHQEWFITVKLFTSEQIFLFLIGFYFLIRGNK
ncbi:DoxX family protein [Pelagibacterales bacterium]|jgi:putative oxidoreductase|nr:DoxX family protein [Pelagibacterales bacterium]MDC1303323.1 DoxX family protein [Pelagibacterales bacterium]|tara:strand:- start:377 stop:784 length:408 start_codon:yes stop_codon:yes gene_type:complete